MPCYSPLKGYLARHVNKSGKRSIVFDVDSGFVDKPVIVPCGQCIGCRLERSRQWAIRCVHEASLYSENCFVTLTYDDVHLPANKSLCLSHFQNFIKRFRLIVGMGLAAGLRYFHCGEYGEKFARPHYHACVFNWDFPDKVFFSTRGGFRLYTSGLLEALWSDDQGLPLGFATIGDVTFESAAYVARYIAKKISGDKAEAHYDGRRPEYITMSRRPGIGSGWFEKYGSDVFPSDECVVRGRKLRPPKFYDRLFEVAHESDFAVIKAKRKVKAMLLAADNTYDRLEVKEAVKTQQYSRLKRGYEHG